MLTEHLLLSTHRPTTETADPSIAIFDLHTCASLTNFKRSCTSKNCLAVSDSHVFAAQSDKAVLNVYNRHKEVLETTVVFPEKFTAVEVAPVGGFLFAGGTESGRLIVWETASGRIISTPQTHLQKITCIAFDKTSMFILTGSADSNVYVWSVPSLLDIRAGANEQHKPRMILDRHQREITAIVTGRAGSGGPSDIAVTGSRDLSCIVWDFHTGSHLRTFIFSSIPLSLALDPADRAVYAGLEDGTIQCVDFLHKFTPDPPPSSSSTETNQLFSTEFRDVPVTLTKNRWSAAGHGSKVLCIGVVYEGNYVVSGSEGGEVCVWDVAKGCLFRTLTKFKAPVTNLKILPPTGFTPNNHHPKKPVHQTTIQKPRYDTIINSTTTSSSSPSTNTTTSQNKYMLTLKFTTDIPEACKDDDDDQTEFKNILRKAALEVSDGVDSKASVSAKDRVVALEEELERLYGNYERLEELQRKTWDCHVRLLLEGGDTDGGGSKGGEDGS